MADASRLLAPGAVRLGTSADDRFDAVRQAGELLISLGAVERPYLDAMQERERSLSSYVGEGVAIPHGTDAARTLVRRGALVFLQFPEGVDWDGEIVRICVGIAASADEHLGAMSQLAQVLLDPDKLEELATTTDRDRVLQVMEPTDREQLT